MAKASGQATSKKTSKSKMVAGNELQKWFNENQEHKDGRAVIMPEGFERLCEALEFDMDGIEPMVLLWQLNGVELGTVELEGWEKGLDEMGVRDLSGLKMAIENTVEAFKTNSELFKTFYRKMFDYLRQDKQKSITAEYAVAVLPVITSNMWVFEKFVEFLKANDDKIKTISRDQWQSLLALSRNLEPDMSNYSKDDAWPTMFDDFVDWAKA
ncbi:DCN1-like protein 5 [Coemansia brasiliensis]|uniref:Defective in cullin neddylation protein n=1 Tax=Coemansia brasiliensis TaxID=2650707 RepID=A0A9W8LZ50_9FUNG|nr:DCN1-like protein 5 [Coemansia brasiliensis]